MKKVSFWMADELVVGLHARKKLTGASFAELTRRAVEAYLRTPVITPDGIVQSAVTETTLQPTAQTSQAQPDAVGFIIPPAIQSTARRSAFRRLYPLLASEPDRKIDAHIHGMEQDLGKVMLAGILSAAPPAAKTKKEPISIDPINDVRHIPAAPDGDNLNMTLTPYSMDDLSMEKNTQPSREQARLEFRHRFRVDPSVADAVIDEQLRSQG